MYIYIYVVEDGITLARLNTQSICLQPFDSEFHEDFSDSR